MHQETQHSRNRRLAAQQAAASAQEIHNMIHRLDPAVAEKVPTAVSAALTMRHQAEDVALAATLAHTTQKGSASAALRAGIDSRDAARKAGAVVALAEHAATLSESAFGETLARRVTKALRGGVVVRALNEAGTQISGHSPYEGVGFSYGGSAKLEVGETVTPEDKASFSIDAHWIEHLGAPTQHCAPVELDRANPHMGAYGLDCAYGLAPRELAPGACRSLPAVLRWPHEEEFVGFLSGSSPRSLALVLGSGPGGSITAEALEAASREYECSLPPSDLVDRGLGGTAAPRMLAAAAARLDGPPLSASCVGGILGREATLRFLTDVREAHAALEHSTSTTEERWRAGQQDAAEALEWLAKLMAQGKALHAGIIDTSTDGLGIARAPTDGLKNDLVRQLTQLDQRLGRLLSEIGPAP
mmetsp:Transcript_67897/g.191386  ORF Transcript_67897/g.191386 Transcript_67897/m.191386 type:complete len:416 (-) Transcript_67897:141-1388(-)